VCLPFAAPQHLRSPRALRAALRELAADRGLPRGRMPTAGDLLALGAADLHQAVLRQGGYAAVAQKAGWTTQRRPAGALADLEAAAEEVRLFAAAAAAAAGGRGGAARMPTHQELRDAGRHDLRHALQVHGSRAVAAVLGLEMSARGGGRVAAAAAVAENEGEEEGGGEGLQEG
jgi:hypothetical protein